MHVAVGRLQFSIVVAAREERRRRVPPDTDRAALEKTFHNEQRLQEVEADRSLWAWHHSIGSGPIAPVSKHSSLAGLPDDPWLSSRHLR